MYLKMYMYLSENKILVQLPHVNKIVFKLTCMSMEFQNLIAKNKMCFLL